jgi:hypothetical protein
MTQTKRTAPDPEWVLMHRQGIPTPKIAAADGVAETTVRYHLVIAAKLDPRIRAEHQASLPAALPSDSSRSGGTLRTSSLSTKPKAGCPPSAQPAKRRWRCGCIGGRQEAAQGTLSPAYKNQTMCEQLPADPTSA